MSSFYSDIVDHQSISWDKLIADLIELKSYNPFCFKKSYYEIFIRLIFSMLNGKKITLLDSDLSEQEIFELTGHHDLSVFEKDIELKKIPSTKTALINALLETKESWQITLYTSGTTGKPKSVSHSFKSITRSLKLYPDNQLQVWGFSYLPTHMAGIQVFLQAVLNGNSIVRLIGLGKTEMLDAILEHQITHISATPTFYRLLLPINTEFLTIIKLTSGGEKFDTSLKAHLSKVFPNASFTNVYASTEVGALFGSNGEFFEVKDSLKEYIKIQGNELFIHQSLLGISMQNNAIWYNTGDLVEIHSNEPLSFKFKSRKSDLINVGGFKINVLEVEDALLRIPEIRQARVFAKSNSVLGNILCCELDTISELTESEIRKILSSDLQEVKIPRVIKFVDQITTTPTGKIKRKVA